MRLAYFPNQTALQSEPVWRSFLSGAQLSGFTPVENDYSADAAVIWSVLWHGRMRNNEKIYNHYRSQNKPVFIIEVGALKRGVTWKISANNITSQGIYGNKTDINLDRPKMLGINLNPVKEKRKSSIVLALQHQKSLQWQGNPDSTTWVREKISKIRNFTDRPIIVRPHPRDLIRPWQEKSVIFEQPKKLANTYDNFDLDFDHHCLINHNSGPGIQSVINGCPVICDRTSLAYPMSNHIEQINQLTMPDRHQWMVEISHTEWTVEEISQGIPIERIKKELTF